MFVLTGAGCSTESGIPDYRDHDGAWKHRPPVDFRDFVKSEATRRRYWARSLLGWPRITEARPNGGHRALAKLESAGLVHHVVTQNVDGLHQRAGSRRVIDLHGGLDTVACLNCKHQISRESWQQALERLNPDFSYQAEEIRPDGDSTLSDEALGRFGVPDCFICGGIVKPELVFFGESVPKSRVDTAFAKLYESDAMLVVGSSLMVYSGFRFCRAAAEQCIPIAAINLGRTRADDLFAIKVTDACTTALERVVHDMELA
jgi:NAD-dependent SIR2 family protein deacetylase